MLTTTMLATRAPKLIAPAMNTGMWENPILQDNLTKLKGYGYHIIDPIIGRLACGDTGTGKMQAEEVIVEHILSFMAKEKDLAGKRYLITAGPTQEAIDPVRYMPGATHRAKWATPSLKWPVCAVLRSHWCRVP